MGYLSLINDEWRLSHVRTRTIAPSQSHDADDHTNPDRSGHYPSTKAEQVQSMKNIEPTPDRLRAFAEHSAGIAPITMLNLLHYREQADYSKHPHETVCSGRDAYRRYAAGAMPCIEAFGGRLVFAGAAAASVIGPEGERWDDVLLVEYPSGQALLDMLASASYRAIAHHRSAALADSRLIPIRGGSPSFQSSSR